MVPLAPRRTTRQVAYVWYASTSMEPMKTIQSSAKCVVFCHVLPMRHMPSSVRASCRAAPCPLKHRILHTVSFMPTLRGATVTDVRKRMLLQSFALLQEKQVWGDNPLRFIKNRAVGPSIRLHFRDVISF